MKRHLCFPLLYTTAAVVTLCSPVKASDPSLISKGNIANSTIGGNVHQNMTTHYHFASTPTGADQLTDLKASLLSQHQKIERSFNGVSQTLQQDIRQMTLVIGPTGYGKSTFLSWLGARTPLQGIKKGFQFVLQAQDADQLIISHDKTTGTYFPTPVVYENPIIGEREVFCDFPGFRDVRGAFSDIVHMAALTDVKKRAEYLKVLLVVNGKTLEEARERDLLDTLNQMCGLFFEDNKQDRMGALVLTKTQRGEEAAYLEKLNEYANDETNLLMPRTRQWLKGYVQQADQHVLFMPVPTSAGSYVYDARDTWQKLTSLQFYQTPLFQPMLTSDSRAKIDEVAAALNQHIAGLLKENTAVLTDEFVYKIKNDTWSYQNLSTFVQEGRACFNFQNQHTTQKEKALRILKSSANVSPYLYEQLSTSIEQIDVLRNLISSSHSVYFDTNQWIDSFHLLRRSLESLWLSIQTPSTTHKEIDYGSFNKQGQGKTKEKLTFSLKNEDPWNALSLLTTNEILTYKRHSYQFKDAQLHSIPIDTYFLHRQGYGVASNEVIETKHHDPIVYREVNRVITPQPFDVKKALKVNLNVQKDYERADRSIYVYQTNVRQNPVKEIRSYFVHDDKALQSFEWGDYNTVYEGQQIALGEQEKTKIPYRPGAITVKAQTHTFKRPYEVVDLEVIRSYQRADYTPYQVKQAINRHRVNKLAPYYDHYDEGFYSQEMIPYEVIYEGKTCQLPTQVHQRIAYTKERTEISAKQETFKARNLTIDLKVIDYYKRGDKSTYTHHHMIQQHPVTPLPLRFIHEDDNLYTKEMQGYEIVYGMQTITLPSVQKNLLPYRMQQTRHEVKTSELLLRNGVVQNEEITLITIQDYQRADDTVYTKISQGQTPVLQEEVIDERRAKKVTTFYAEVLNGRTVLSVYEEDYSVLPKIADGYEQVYKRFMNGALVYKPNANNTQGMLTFPFRDWVNPYTLKGTCDLYSCGNADRYLIINSGYRTQKSGRSKIEVYIMPRFLVEKELGRDFGQHRAIKAKWTSDIGILFSWGKWNDNSWGEYQTKDNFDKMSTQNLSEIIRKSPASTTLSVMPLSQYMLHNFFIQFLDNI